MSQILGNWACIVGRKCDGSIFLGMARRVVGSFSAEIAEIFALFAAVKETVSRGFRIVPWLSYGRV